MLVPVYDIKNCGPRHRFVANGKLVHNSDGINLQNLPSRGSTNLKACIEAPPGYVIIDCDSSNIEARVLAWLAGQDDLVQDFANKVDAYCKLATKIYGKTVTPANELERFVGKTVTLGCGYQTGAGKLKVTLKAATPSVDLDIVECEKIINTYRGSVPHIVDLWARGEESIRAMYYDESMWLGREGVALIEGKKGIKLPSGLYISYPQLHRAQGERFVEWRYKDDTGVVNIYGGKLIENCLAEGSLVLTNRGWVSIESVRADDLVHDGVEFVKHGGAVFKSVQTCVSIDGVFMTPDHEVLTNEGWIPASQNPEPYRPNIRNAHSTEPRTERRKEEKLAIPVPVRQPVRQSWSRCNEGGKTRGDTKLRVFNKEIDGRSSYNTWDERTSSVRCVAKYAGPVQTIFAQGLEKLWWAGDHCLRTLENVRKLLVRHGSDIRSWVRFGPYRQRWALQSGELSVGESPNKHHEQTDYDPIGRRAQIIRRNWYRPQYNLLQTETRLDSRPTQKDSEPFKPVYDILNAGPRQRFVVLGNNGPFVVHNCVQALARIIVMSQMLRISRKLPVKLTVHDSVIALAREDERQAARAYVESCMRWVPDWAQGCPLNCKSKWGYNYGELHDD